MSTAKSSEPARTSAARDARQLLVTARNGALGTIERDTGGPFVSLVAVATTAAAAPVLLLSQLALHTRNLAADPRSSLLLAESFSAGDPLALSRVTLFGTIRRHRDDAVRSAFLKQHPEAEVYVDFADFDFYVLDVEKAHFVGGFGRIVELSRNDLLAQ